MSVNLVPDGQPPVQPQPAPGEAQPAPGGQAAAAAKKADDVDIQEVQPQAPIFSEKDGVYTLGKEAEGKPAFEGINNVLIHRAGIDLTKMTDEIQKHIQLKDLQPKQDMIEFMVDDSGDKPRICAMVTREITVPKLNENKKPVENAKGEVETRTIKIRQKVYTSIAAPTSIRDYDEATRNFLQAQAFAVVRTHEEGVRRAILTGGEQCNKASFCCEFVCGSPSLSTKSHDFYGNKPGKLWAGTSRAFDKQQGVIGHVFTSFEDNKVTRSFGQWLGWNPDGKIFFSDEHGESLLNQAIELPSPWNRSAEEVFQKTKKALDDKRPIAEQLSEIAEKEPQEALFHTEDQLFQDEVVQEGALRWMNQGIAKKNLTELKNAQTACDRSQRKAASTARPDIVQAEERNTREIRNRITGQCKKLVKKHNELIARLHFCERAKNEAAVFGGDEERQKTFLKAYKTPTQTIGHTFGLYDDLGKKGNALIGQFKEQAKTLIKDAGEIVSESFAQELRNIMNEHLQQSGKPGPLMDIQEIGPRQRQDAVLRELPAEPKAPVPGPGPVLEPQPAPGQAVPGQDPEAPQPPEAAQAQAGPAALAPDAADGDLAL